MNYVKFNPLDSQALLVFSLDFVHFIIDYSAS